MIWIGMAAGVVIGFVCFMTCAARILRSDEDRVGRADAGLKARHREAMEVHWKLLALHERKTKALETIAAQTREDSDA